MLAWPTRTYHMPQINQRYEAKLPLVEAAQAKWDKRMAKRLAKKRSHGDGNLLTVVTRPKSLSGNIKWDYKVFGA